MTATEDRPKGRSLQPLKTLIPFLAPYRGTLILALGALIVASGALLALPVAVRYLIDAGLAAETAAAIDRYFIGLLVAAGVYAVFAALRLYLVTWLGERVVADLRDRVYRHVIGLDPTFFEITKSGEVLSRLTTDTTLIQSIAGVGLSITLRSALNLIGGLTMLALTSAKLMGFILVLVPLVIVPLIVIGRRVRKLSRASQDRVADTSGLAGETINAIQTVQAFTLERLQGDRFGLAVEDAFKTAVRRIRVRSALTAIAILFVFGAITVVLWIGARAVMGGEMTAGQLGQFVLYAMFVAGAAASLSEMWGEVQRAAGAMERLTELLQTSTRIATAEPRLALPDPCGGSVRFDNVSFRYPSRQDTWALRDFSLDVAEGETVALVGPSGAGKSTLFQVLLRFYNPEAGTILIDGVDTSHVDPTALRGHIGLVPQETVIFGESARENIRYGRPDATDAEVEEAAIAAAAAEFIEQLPDRYDTFLGERGTRLSGGQRQRIAIARAILRNPPILLLDEATSALDSESERLVQQALERLMVNRTTLIIAHRLATVLKADKIVVLDSGSIQAIGRHEELIQRNDLYRRLAELQFGAAELARSA